MVKDMISYNQWDMDKLRKLMLEKDINRIVKIPLSVLGGKDKLYWMFSPTGQYTVKSGYAVAKERCRLKESNCRQEGSTSHNKEGNKSWKLLWNLNIKQKLKHFMWKALHNILPVKEEIYRRTGKGENVCSCCGEEIETLEHLFFWCDNAKRAWKVAPIQWDGLLHLRHSFWKWWEELAGAITRPEGKEHISLTINILWQIWKARNDWTFNRKRKLELQVISKAVGEWREFKEGTSKEQVPNDDSTIEMQRQRPEEGCIFLNTDTALLQHRNKAGEGIVAKNADGVMLACWAIS